MARSAFERRILAALDASPSRIPIVVGGCGTGRSVLLHQLRERIGRGTCQYVDIERTATTPERFLRALVDLSPFARSDVATRTATPRQAFLATLAFLEAARASGGTPATFLLDEVLDLRTFESFPGLRHLLREVLEALTFTPNRFVLTTRYVTRAHRLLRDGSPRFEVVPMAPWSAADIGEMLPLSSGSGSYDLHEHEHLARVVHALSDGRAVYARAIADELAAMGTRGAADPISALTALLAPGGRLHARCGFSYELRLHRARGYGVLKAILEIVADEELLTLTEIARRLQRTPGSTKDYLSWLEDVDLVVARQKRYSFTDPLLRVWVRLHCRPTPPSEEDVAREVHTYALARLPQVEPAMALAGGGADDDARKSWGIIEID